jgi:DNA-binding NtrC family response regulator
VPPLRERPKTFTLLVFHFLETYKQKTGRFVSGISKEALRALVNYEWHGNVRELENAIERAVIIASGRQIELDDLPEAISKKAFEVRASAAGTRFAPPANRAEIETAQNSQIELIRQRGVKNDDISDWLRYFGIDNSGEL